MENSIHWHTKVFEELTTEELYDILQLRVNVFVVEQKCAYPELDGKDKKSLHVFATKKDKIVAAARIVPPGLSYPQMSIGRVVIDPQYRKYGLGKELMQYCLAKIEEEFEAQDIQIGAQVYLQKFYMSFGFENVSDSYLEDGIPHIDMLRAKDKYTN